MTQYIDEPSREYEDFVSSHIKGHLFQSKYWKDVKCNWTWRGIIVRDGGGNIKGTMAVIIRKVPFTPYSMMYSPRGPVCDIYDRETMRELTLAAKKLAGEHRAYVLKIDPDVEKGDIAYKNLLLDLGYELLPGAEGFENIQPQNVVRLRLRGLDKDQVFSAFKSKVRYNIRLAQRRGVQVRECSAEALGDFHRIMQETGQRDKFGIRSREYFENMLRALGSHGRLYMAYYEGKPIAGTIFAYYGDKAWYLYGASSNTYRNVMPNYLLQWTMIQCAVDHNCSIYDFRGVSLNENSGLLKFKSGWGGNLTQFIGELEYVYMPRINKIMKKLLPFGKKLLRLIKKG